MKKRFKNIEDHIIVKRKIQKKNIIDKSECKYYIYKEKYHLANGCPIRRTKRIEEYAVIRDLSEIRDSKTIYKITSNVSEFD